MYPQNSLVSLMAHYHDSDDDEEPEANIQNNLNFLNLNPPQSNILSQSSPNTNNNNKTSNVPAQTASFEMSNVSENQSANVLASQFDLDNDISFPPEPIAGCEPVLQEKITKFYQKIEAGQLDMNQWIQKRKEFCNPSIYEKLIGYCNIDELGTNYPRDKFDPSQWPEDSYYDKLAEVQSRKMNKLLGKK